MPCLYEEECHPWARHDLRQGDYLYFLFFPENWHIWKNNDKFQSDLEKILLFSTFSSFMCLDNHGGNSTTTYPSAHAALYQRRWSSSSLSAFCRLYCTSCLKKPSQLKNDSMLELYFCLRHICVDVYRKINYIHKSFLKYNPMNLLRAKLGLCKWRFGKDLSGFAESVYGVWSEGWQ